VLEARGIEPYVVFAKLTDFSDAELMRIQRMNAPERKRVIVLTERELDHWFPYKWAEEKEGRMRYGTALGDFAAASVDLYLRPAAERSTR
jgi:hypothetical protein